MHLAVGFSVCRRRVARLRSSHGLFSLFPCRRGFWCGRVVHGRCAVGSRQLKTDVSPWGGGMTLPEGVAAGFLLPGLSAASFRDGTVGGHARGRVASSRATGPGRRGGILRARCVPRRQPQLRLLRLPPLLRCRLGCLLSDSHSSSSVLCCFVCFAIVRSVAVHDHACLGD